MRSTHETLRAQTRSLMVLVTDGNAIAETITLDGVTVRRDRTIIVGNDLALMHVNGQWFGVPRLAKRVARVLGRKLTYKEVRAMVTVPRAGLTEAELEFIASAGATDERAWARVQRDIVTRLDPHAAWLKQYELLNRGIAAPTDLDIHITRFWDMSEQEVHQAAEQVEFVRLSTSYTVPVQELRNLCAVSLGLTEAMRVTVLGYRVEHDARTGIIRTGCHTWTAKSLATVAWQLGYCPTTMSRVPKKLAKKLDKRYRTLCDEYTNTQQSDDALAALTPADDE